MKIPVFADMLMMSERVETKKPRAKRGANPKNKPGPKPGKKAATATVSDPLGAPPPMRNWRTGEYKPSTAMREALGRAHAEQTPLMSLASNVPPAPRQD